MPLPPMDTNMSAPGPGTGPGPSPDSAGSAGVASLAGLQGAPGGGVGDMAGAGNQKADEMLMQAMEMFAQATKLDPSLEIVRKDVQNIYLKVAELRGFKEEATQGIKMAQMMQRRGPGQPPMGGPGGGAGGPGPGPGGPMGGPGGPSGPPMA